MWDIFSLASQSSSMNDLIVPDVDIELLAGILASQFDTDFDMQYGIVPPQQTVIVRAYSDDTDDQVLAEIQPKFIVMFEPSLEFVRRIEVYRNSSPGLGVRVYFMIYQLSCEEHKYLAGLRREKESFERLIKERGVRVFVRTRIIRFAHSSPCSPCCFRSTRTKRLEARLENRLSNRSVRVWRVGERS